MSKNSDAALIQELRDRLDRLEGRLPAEAAAPPAPGVKLDFPRCVYKDVDGDGVINADHPGNESKVVQNQDELDEALEDGWGLTHTVPKPAKGKKGQPSTAATAAAPAPIVAKLSRADHRQPDRGAKAVAKKAATK
jgi:hypothetical protein